MTNKWNPGWPDLAALEGLPSHATVELAVVAMEGGRAVVPCSVQFLRDAPEFALLSAQRDLDRTFQSNGVTQGAREWRVSPWPARPSSCDGDGFGVHGGWPISEET